MDKGTRDKIVDKITESMSNLSDLKDRRQRIITEGRQIEVLMIQIQASIDTLNRLLSDNEEQGDD